MKILAVSDIEESILLSSTNERFRDIDCILSCGDLEYPYLDMLTSRINAPLYYVWGNHDSQSTNGGVCLEDQIVDMNGFKVCGFGGSMRYKPGNHMYTEKEMRHRLMRFRHSHLFLRSVDIFVTHAPAKGYGDLDDLCHTGFDCFNDFLEYYKPKYMLHGHVHLNYGRLQSQYQHPSGTKIINVYGYQIIEL
ncbi:MAG: metallophosphoesterase family protein [Faecalicoccus sp.]|nr:metallophosphoesterase family protein [Faecalicoccus sp.]